MIFFRGVSSSGSQKSSHFSCLSEAPGDLTKVCNLLRGQKNRSLVWKVRLGREFKICQSVLHRRLPERSCITSLVCEGSSKGSGRRVGCWVVPVG